MAVGHRRQGSSLLIGVAYLRCCYCKCECDINDCHARGRTYACKHCNAARIGLQNHYKSLGKEHLWRKMNKAEKKQLIVQHKGKSEGRGKRFPVKIGEEAGCCADWEVLWVNR